MNRSPNYSVIPTLEKGEMKKKISYLIPRVSIYVKIVSVPPCYKLPSS